MQITISLSAVCTIFCNSARLWFAIQQCYLRTQSDIKVTILIILAPKLFPNTSMHLIGILKHAFFVLAALLMSQIQRGNIKHLCRKIALQSIDNVRINRKHTLITNPFESNLKVVQTIKVHVQHLLFQLLFRYAQHFACRS